MKEEIKLKSGIVAIVDALGTKQTDPEVMYHRIIRIIDRLKKNKRSKWTYLEELTGKQIEYDAFSDSIIFSLEVGNDIFDACFYNFAVWLQVFMKEGLEEKLLYRGAISFGTYIRPEDEKIILGTAISDAATWYSEANWAGIILTPRCALKFYGLPDPKPLGVSDRVARLARVGFFVEYPVPMKNGGIDKFVALAWPSFYFQDEPMCSLEEMRGGFLTDINEILADGIPAGTEPKYLNTLEFVDWCIQNVIKPVLDESSES